MCIGGGKISGTSACCKHCVMTKICEVAYDSTRSVLQMNDSILCLECWKKMQLLRCYEAPESTKVAYLPDFLNLLANAHYEKTGKEVKHFTMWDMSPIPDVKLLKNIKEAQRQATQLMLCMEMQYFDEPIITEAKKVLMQWEVMFEKEVVLSVSAFQAEAAANALLAAEAAKIAAIPSVDVQTIVHYKVQQLYT